MKLEAICGYDIHPAASAFPLMPQRDLEELAADIAAHGQHQPIVLHQGKVIDGRNRLMACKIAGVNPQTAEWKPNGDGSLVAFILGANLKRRHLNESQRAMLAAELLPMFEKEAKDRQRAHGGTSPGKKADSAPGREVKGKAAEAVAEVANVATRSVERAKFVAKTSPELAAEVKSGRTTLKRAEEQIRNPRAVAARTQGDENDVRFTPRKLIEDLHREHRFTVDAASDPSSPAAQIIGKHWTKKDDGLQHSWADQRVFNNPPFSEIPAWVAKAHHEARRAELIVMLLPATRTEQPFWHKYIEPYRDLPGSGVRTKFLSGRTRFGAPADPEGESSGSPPFGCVLVTWQRQKMDEKPEIAARVYEGAKLCSNCQTGVEADVRDLGTLDPLSDHLAKPADDTGVISLAEYERRAEARGLAVTRNSSGQKDLVEVRCRTCDATIHFRLTSDGDVHLGRTTMQLLATHDCKKTQPAPEKKYFDWKLSSARIKKAHAYEWKRGDLGLCGATLGFAGDAVYPPDSKNRKKSTKYCEDCLRLAGATSTQVLVPPKPDEDLDVIALSEFTRDSKHLGFRVKTLPGKTAVEIRCSACASKLEVPLTKHLDVPKASERHFHEWAHRGHLHEKPKRKKAVRA